MEFRTAQTVLPGLQRKYTAFHDLEAYLVEKFNDVGESEYRIEFVGVCLVDQGFVKKNSEVSLKEHVGSVAKQLGDEITIRRFVRFQVGETPAA